MTSKKRTITILLAAVLALSLLLTACSTGGDTPTGDNTTPGTSSTPGVTDTQTPTPDNTTEPDNTPDASDPSTPGASETPTDEQQYGMPTWADPSTYVPEKKANMDLMIEYYGEMYGVDIDKLIDEVIAEYGQYILVQITPEAVRTAIVAGNYADGRAKKTSYILSCLPENSIQKVNEYLINNGAESLGDFVKYENVDDAKKDIARLAIAASLYYEPNFEGAGDDVLDLLVAFARAYFGADVTDNIDYNLNFTSNYVLFDLEF